MAEPYKVMLIDDDCGVHTLIKRILEDAGYSYCGAYGGEEGLEMLSTEHPDLLLLDVMMPGMNGFDVCKSIREKGRRIPVVFLSAKGDIVDKSIGFKAGGDDYVVKPFSSEELLLRIEAHLRGKKIDLTAKEFEILALLASNPGQAFTRGQIYEHIWGRDSNVDESSITVFMRKIREKIEDNPSQPKYLLTVWRVGYKFAERV